MCVCCHAVLSGRFCRLPRETRETRAQILCPILERRNPSTPLVGLARHGIRHVHRGLRNTFQVRKHLNSSDLFRCVRSDSDEGEWDEHHHHDHYTISGPDMEMWLAQQCALPCLSMTFNCLFTASFLLNFHCLFAAFSNLRTPSHRRVRKRGQVRAHSLPLQPAATPAAAAAAAAVSILFDNFTLHTSLRCEV